MNAIEVITELPAEVRALLLDIEMLDAESDALVIVDDAQCKFWVGETLPRVKGYFKRLEDKRRSRMRPLLEAGKAIDDLFRPSLDLLGEIEKRIKAAYTVFRRKQADEALRLAAERAREEAERRAQNAINAAAQLEAQGRDAEAVALVERVIEAPLPPVTTAAPPPVKIRGVSTRKVWRWEIENEAEIPREYLCADRERITARVKTFGAESGIPGIRVWIEEEVSSRSIAPGR